MYVCMYVCMYWLECGNISNETRSFTKTPQTSAATCLFLTKGSHDHNHAHLTGSLSWKCWCVFQLVRNFTIIVSDSSVACIFCMDIDILAHCGWFAVRMLLLHNPTSVQNFITYSLICYTDRPTDITYRTVNGSLNLTTPSLMKFFRTRVITCCE